MNSASYLKQTKIYFGKNRRIFVNEKGWKFVIFSAVISLVIALVIGEDMFVTFEGTKSGFFTLLSAYIWIGIFNSIQSVCKEHDIIRSEYRAGMKLSAYITAGILWQTIICFIQTLIMLCVCIPFVDFPESGVILPHALAEYFISFFLITFGSDILGIMVSSVSGSPNTAMTAMPFVLILQLIMSGVLFDLEGATELVAYVTFSKWGMSALGCISDLNSPDLPYRINEQADLPFTINKEDMELEACYDRTAENLLLAWGIMLLISAVCAAVSVLSLKIRNHNS